MNFAENLQALRKSRGMSQENLAELIGVSRQAVSKWESGQSYPEMDKLILLSDLFGVSIDSMVKGINGSSADGASNENKAQRRSFADLKSMMHYEYKSRRKLFNVPLVHINIGYGIYVAKGILAVGNIAVGLFSVGIIALGVLCLGALALGLIGFGGLSLGLLLSFGGVSVGVIAVGGVALGVFAVGGLSVGVFSLGGCAIASHIAIGGYASGHIAIGDIVKGSKVICDHNHNLNSIKASQVRALINQEYPHLWKPITDLITSIFT
jgi:transcriptional regulator with XRE-family HTH domain